MTDKEKIRAEIERRMKGKCPIVCSYVIYEDILDFIDSMQEEPTIPDIVDEHYWEMLGEEPVSEDLWESSKRYALLQVFASTDAVMTEQAYLSLKLFSGFEIAVAHKDGANWQKQEIMKNAKDGVITFDYYGDNDKTYGCVAHDSFSLEELGLKDGDKVKMIIIKEEDQ